MPSSSSLALKDALAWLNAHPYPHVANPPDCKKRASVALVIRVRPRHGQTSTLLEPSQVSPQLPFDQRINDFFAQVWVRTGIPEILFIRRVARASDRWGGHVAFPGGKREQSDANDRAASIRETQEEIGLSLENEYCLPVGNLPERLVTAAWGKKPLMILCPFVYLMLRYDTPPLDPQPSEVQSIHWVPLHSILEPRLRAYQTTQVSDRIVPLQVPLIKPAMQALIGSLVFSAVQLAPSQSIFSIDQKTSGRTGVQESDSDTISRSLEVNLRPLVLWGLTLGMTADLLNLVDANTTSTLWSWPTFSQWDLRLVCWLCTRSLRNERASEAKIEDAGRESRLLGSLDATTYTSEYIAEHASRSLSIAGAHSLDDYFEQMKHALTLTVGLRLSLGLVAAIIMARKLRRP